MPISIHIFLILCLIQLHQRHNTTLYTHLPHTISDTATPKAQYQFVYTSSSYHIPYCYTKGTIPPYIHIFLVLYLIQLHQRHNTNFYTHLPHTISNTATPKAQYQFLYTSPSYYSPYCYTKGTIPISIHIFLILYPILLHQRHNTNFYTHLPHTISHTATPKAQYQFLYTSSSYYIPYRYTKGTIPIYIHISLILYPILLHQRHNTTLYTHLPHTISHTATPKAQYQFLYTSSSYYIQYCYTKGTIPISIHIFLTLYPTLLHQRHNTNFYTHLPHTTSHTATLKAQYQFLYTSPSYYSPYCYTKGTIPISIHIFLILYPILLHQRHNTNFYTHLPHTISNTATPKAQYQFLYTSSSYYIQYCYTKGTIPISIHIFLILHPIPLHQRHNTNLYTHLPHTISHTATPKAQYHFIYTSSSYYIPYSYTKGTIPLYIHIFLILHPIPLHQRHNTNLCTHLPHTISHTATPKSQCRFLYTSSSYYVSYSYTKGTIPLYIHIFHILYLIQLHQRHNTNLYTHLPHTIFNTATPKAQYHHIYTSSSYYI